MIEIEYARQDDPQIRVLPDRLTVDAAGRARLRSYSNGRWPGVDGVGVFERQLRADELALLGKTLASEKLKAAGDPGQVPVGSLLRLLGVKDAAGTVTRAAAIGSEPPQLVPFFQQLDALMAELRGFPLRGAQLDWDLTSSAGGELAGIAWLTNPGNSAATLSLPASGDAQVRFELQSWPEGREDALQSTPVTLTADDGSPLGAELQLAAGQTRTLRFSCKPGAAGSDPQLGRLLWSDSREPAAGSAKLAGALYSVTLPLVFGAGATEDVPDPHCGEPGTPVAVRELFVSAPKAADDTTPQERWTRCMQTNLTPPGFLLTMPVRDLTRADAVKVCIYLAQQGYITTKPIIQFDDACAVTAPLVGQKIKISPTVKTPGAGSVLWKRVATIPWNEKTGAFADDLNMDPRGIVLVWRVSSFLAGEFGATNVWHPGFTSGRTPNDCHDEGRAIDFTAVAGTFPNPLPRDPVLAGKDYQLIILIDWGNRPVPKGAGPPTASYRLAADKTLDPTTGKDAAEQAAFLKRRAAAVVFEAFYEDFVAKNSSDRSQKRLAYNPATGAPAGAYDPATGATDATAGDPNAPSSTVGQTQGFAIGPDYGSSAGLRTDHQNHLHFQVATTGHETKPP